MRKNIILIIFLILSIPMNAYAAGGALTEADLAMLNSLQLVIESYGIGLIVGIVIKIFWEIILVSY